MKKRRLMRFLDKPYLIECVLTVILALCLEFVHHLLRPPTQITASLEELAKATEELKDLTLILLFFAATCLILIISHVVRAEVGRRETLESIDAIQESMPAVSSMLSIYKAWSGTPWIMDAAYDTVNSLSKLASGTMFLDVRDDVYSLDMKIIESLNPGEYVHATCVYVEESQFTDDDFKDYIIKQIEATNRHVSVERIYIFKDKKTMEESDAWKSHIRDIGDRLNATATSASQTGGKRQVGTFILRYAFADTVLNRKILYRDFNLFGDTWYSFASKVAPQAEVLQAEFGVDASVRRELERDWKRWRRNSIECQIDLAISVQSANPPNSDT